MPFGDPFTLFATVINGEVGTARTPEGSRVIVGDRADIEQIFGRMSSASVIGVPSDITPTIAVRDLWPLAFRRGPLTTGA